MFPTTSNVFEGFLQNFSQSLLPLSLEEEVERTFSKGSSLLALLAQICFWKRHVGPASKAQILKKAVEEYWVVGAVWGMAGKAG